MELPDFKKMKLFDRIGWAHHFLEKAPTTMRCVYEDPALLDQPATVLVPSGRWMAMALFGNLLPPVHVYLNMPLELTTKDGRKIKCTKSESEEIRLHEEIKHEAVLPHHQLHTAEPIGSMTEEQAMEYLIMKDVPRRVWDESMYPSNYQRFFICDASQLPQKRHFRNAWKINKDFVEEGVSGNY